MQQNNENANESKSTLVISYLILRKTLGILGLSFPFILAIGACILGGYGIQSSVSSYYYTNMRDIFAGILFAIGLFLFSYRGYDLRDDLVGDLACQGGDTALRANGEAGHAWAVVKPIGPFVVQLTLYTDFVDRRSLETVSMR